MLTKQQNGLILQTNIREMTSEKQLMEFNEILMHTCSFLNLLFYWAEKSAILFIVVHIYEITL